VTAHLANEPVCKFLLATRKAGAAEYHAGNPVFAEVSRAAPEVCARHPDIARAVKEAARYGFKGRNLRRKPLPVVHG
jgi:hypothetical protein